MSFDSQPVLLGELVELRPLRPEDYPDLYAVASDPLIWEQHPASNRYEEAVFRVFFEEALASGGALVVIDAESRRIIGSSRYHAYDPERSEVEIGWTFLARTHWGGRYNGEMKRLMLEHAFRFVRSVLFLIGTGNVRSQRAVERIGAVRVGTRAEPGGLVSYVYQIEAPAQEIGDGSGEGTPLDRWVPMLYEELRALAGKLLADRGPAVTLQPTSLVHEAYLRLAGQRRMDWENRLHFFAVAARVMRRVLVDHCRARLAQKRGGAFLAVELAEAAGPAPREVDVLTVDGLLTNLEKFDPQQARIVELRFFAGLTVEETAEALEISKSSVKRDWAMARAWMAQQMAPRPESHGS